MTAGGPNRRHGEHGRIPVLRLREPEWMDAELHRWAAKLMGERNSSIKGKRRRTEASAGISSSTADKTPSPGCSDVVHVMCAPEELDRLQMEAKPVLGVRPRHTKPGESGKKLDDGTLWWSPSSGRIPTQTITKRINWEIAAMRRAKHPAVRRFLEVSARGLSPVHTTTSQGPSSRQPDLAPQTSTPASSVSRPKHSKSEGSPGMARNGNTFSRVSISDSESNASEGSDSDVRDPSSVASNQPKPTPLHAGRCSGPQIGAS